MSGGKVESDYENDYEIINKYDDYRKCFRDIKDYNQKKICTGFRFNNNIGKEDVDKMHFLIISKKLIMKKNVIIILFYVVKLEQRHMNCHIVIWWLMEKDFIFHMELGWKNFFLWMNMNSFQE